MEKTSRPTGLKIVATSAESLVTTLTSADYWSADRIRSLSADSTDCLRDAVGLTLIAASPIGPPAAAFAAGLAIPRCMTAILSDLMLPADKNAIVHEKVLPYLDLVGFQTGLIGAFFGEKSSIMGAQMGSLLSSTVGFLKSEDPSEAARLLDGMRLIEDATTLMENLRTIGTMPSIPSSPEPPLREPALPPDSGGNSIRYDYENNRQLSYVA